MIKLTKQEIIDISNKAGDMFCKAEEGDILSFDEVGNTVVPKILRGDERKYTGDYFSRDENICHQVFIHLAALYGDDEAF